MPRNERLERSRSAATAFAELNAVLHEIAERASAILGENLVGVYLQGSFASGDADLYSDCDFLIPIHKPLAPQQEAGLRQLHGELPKRPEHWAQHLEGSYPVASELRTVAGFDREWLYVDHGASEMEWSAHCNTDVARWTLREHGVRLLGPAPKTLVDEVPPHVLRGSARGAIPTVLADIESWISLDVAWGQRYAVSTVARMLYTLHTAEVASKRGALTWVHDTLDPQWRALMTQVIADRPRGFDLADPARPGSVQHTRGFAAYATELAAER